MALTAGSITDLDLNSSIELVPTAFTAADGITFPYDGPDQQMILVLENSHASTASTFTIEKGDGIQGVADKSVTVAAGKRFAAVFESSMIKHLNDTHKGKIFITAAGGTPAAALLRVGVVALGG